jgi:hypothetical protein
VTQLTAGNPNPRHNGRNIRHWNCAMKPETPLKLNSIAFAILWTVWMVWWSGVFNPVNIGIMSAGGVLTAWLWFLAMRWYFRRIGLLPKVERALTPSDSRHPPSRSIR